MAAKVDRQERWMKSAQGEQEAINAQIQRLSRLHDQLQGDYESLDGMSTDQLASLMSRLDTLESADHNAEAKLAEFEQKIGQIPSDQLASLMSKIASLEADDQTVEAKLSEFEQKINQIPTGQLTSMTSMMSKINALEADDQTVEAKLAGFEQKIDQIPTEQLASLMSKIASLEADDQSVEAKLAGFEQKINEVSTDPSVSLISRIDSLEAEDQAVEAKLSEFEQKTNDIEALVQALEAGLATQERTVEGFKGELEKVSNLAAQNQEHTLRLEGQAQDHAATLTALKMNVSRQTALHEELTAGKGGISRSSGELDRKVEELGKANNVLKFDTLKQSTNLDKLSSSLNVRSWALGALSFLAIATVLLAFLHTQGEIASNRDVFYAELAAIERTPGSQDQSGATGKAVIRELQRLNTSMAKLARLESKPWPRDPELKLVQRDMAELTDEISSLKTRMDEAQTKRTAYRTDFPRVAVVSAVDLGTSSLGGGDSREYTIQLMGGFRKSSIAGFVRENGLARDVALFELEYQGKPWFVLLYGKYTSFEQASNTLHSLPEELTRHKAWIRYLPRSL
jgi:septal ring-binding cell division protein DamX